MSRTEPPCRPGLSGLSVARHGAVLLRVQARGDPSQQCWLGLSNLPITLGEFSGSREREVNVQGRVTEGDTSQMVDFHVWDVVAVEDLRDFIAEGMCSSWALLFCVCVFFKIFGSIELIVILGCISDVFSFLFPFSPSPNSHSS